MRAVYLTNVNCRPGEALRLSDEAFHHLANVVRVRVGDEILVLNGLGLRAVSKVSAIHKKELTLDVLQLEMKPRSSGCDVLLVIPKKDALESMLKAATELGVNKIILLRGEYSSEKLPEDRRVQSILQNALEQSNNPWLPEVVLCDSWQSLVIDEYHSIGVLDVAPASSQKVRMTGQQQLLVIGPEGGFSEAERRLMKSWAKAQFISFPTPILRAPTAMVAALGWWYGQA